MNTRLQRLIFSLLVLLTACTPDTPTSGDLNAQDKPSYVTLSDDLTQLKIDFNAMTDKVRLVFISGPSCGICLRGMDDLNESIVASIQNDPRIHTFVLQVPTLGAEEEHAAAAVPLMPGPRVNHYWDPGGKSGLEFQKALGIGQYAWDVWMVYEPGARWEPASAPPPPVFWQHQLGEQPDDSRLDPDLFASVVRDRLAALPPASEATRLAAVDRTDPGILRVAQPRGAMIQHNHESRGGYHKLKTISSIRYEGETIVNGQTYPMTIETARPHYYKRVVTSGTGHPTVSWDGAQVTREGISADLPADVQDELLASYEFDGWMTDWKAKGHKLRRLGMKKHGDKLPWMMEVELANGRTWHIYVDSHSGDAFRQTLIDADGQETLAVEFDNYRDVDGFRLPHEIRYFSRGRLLATDRFRRIVVESGPSATASADGALPALFVVDDVINIAWVHKHQATGR
jgi:hypothetical protein